MPARAEVSCARILPLVAAVTPRSRYWKNSRRPGTGRAPLPFETASSILGPFALAAPSMVFSLRYRVLDEFLRHGVTPLREEPIPGRNLVGGRAGVEDVGVGPVLVDPAPGIVPVIVDLGAEHVAADAPDMLVLARFLQMFLAEHHVVEIAHLERQMVEAVLRSGEAEENMVIDIIVAAVEPVERADDVALVAFINVVRDQETQRLAVPFERG